MFSDLNKKERTIIIAIILAIIVALIALAINLLSTKKSAPSAEDAENVDAVSDKYNSLLKDFFSEELKDNPTSKVKAKFVKSDEYKAPEFVVAQVVNQVEEPERLYLVTIHDENVTALVNYDYEEISNEFEHTIYVSPEDNSASIVVYSEDKDEYLGTRFIYENGEYVTQNETVNDVDDPDFKEVFVPDDYDKITVDDLEDMGNGEEFVEYFDSDNFDEEIEAESETDEAAEDEISAIDDITYTINTTEDKDNGKDLKYDLVVFESKSGKFSNLNKINKHCESKVLDIVTMYNNDHLTHNISDVHITDKYIFIKSGFGVYSDGAAHGYGEGTSSVYDVNTGELCSLIDVTGLSVDEINQRVRDYLPESNEEVYNAFGYDYLSEIEDENDVTLYTFYIDEEDDIWLENMLWPPASGGHYFPVKFGNLSEFMEVSSEENNKTGDIEIVTFVDETVEEMVINETKFVSHIRLPKVLIGGEDYAEVNDMVDSFWKKVTEELPGSGWIINSDYYTYDNENYLSLVVLWTEGQPFTGTIDSNWAFVFDKNTNSVLTYDEILEISGFDEEDVYNAVKKMEDQMYYIDTASVKLFFKENMELWGYGNAQNWGDTEFKIG